MDKSNSSIALRRSGVRIPSGPPDLPPRAGVISFIIPVVGGVDLGKVILSNFFVEEYDEAVINAKLNNISLIDEEINIFGFDHTEASRVLGLKWKLPDKILTPIVFHHNADNLPVAFKKEIMMIHLAEYITKKAEIGGNGDPLEFKLNFGLVSEFKIRDSEINEMTEQIINLKEKIYNFTEILL